MKLTLNALIKVNHIILLYYYYYKIILGKNSSTIKRRKTQYNFQTLIKKLIQIILVLQYGGSNIKGWITFSNYFKKYYSFISLK